MSRRERRPPRAARLLTLLEEGDHGAARAEARALLADPAAVEADRDAAAAALASLAPEPGALVAGGLGLAAAVAILVLTVVAR